jgi:branched-chain amino acid transport system ATP-binding protein
LIADELSLGLAPLIVQRLFGALDDARRRGVGVLMIEQHAAKALAVADRGYVLNRGAVVHAGTAAELRGRMADIEGAYLASANAGQK